jgi:excisionase family DNA binding protein
MSDQASPPTPATSADSVVLLPGALETVIRAFAGAITSRGARQAQSGDPVADKPLLDLEETAELLGVSRMTVARMADEGRLPSVIVRRGRVQKTRRIPRAFVDRMVADACAGAQVDIEEYAAAWLAEHIEAPGGAAQDASQEPRARGMKARWSAGGAAARGRTEGAAVPPTM